MERMGPESIFTVVESSTMQSVPDLIPSSSTLVPATCEINPEITSNAGKVVPGDFQQGDRQLSTVDSIMWNGDSKDILAVKAKDSGEPENSSITVLPGVSTNPNSAEDDVNDVKVCDICGDVGYEEVLVICSECNEGAEHIYCMQIHLEAVPEGDWFCDTCKLKHKANEQKKAGIESNVQDSKAPSLSRSAGKQGNDGNIVLMSSSSAKLKTPSEKVKTHKPLQSSFPCKRQIEDSSGAPDSKKQAIERGNEVVHAPGPSLQRDNSLKTQETANADFHGAFQRIRISVRPPHTRDGSFKMLEAAKSESVNMTASVFNNSMQRSLSRENSFKIVETSKVKFLPSTTSASPSSGTALRTSGKPTGVDGKSGLVSSRTGLGNSGLSSSRRSTIPMTDSAGGTTNRSGGQPPFRQAPANTPLKRVGLSKSGDTLPSFLLSTRPGNSSRGHLASRGNKEIRSGNGQVVGQPSEPSTPTGQNLKTSKTMSFIHADLKQWKDNQIISPGNAEMKVIKGPSAAECPVGNSLGEKPNGHHNSMPSISTSENCRSDKTMALVKEDFMDLAMQKEDLTRGPFLTEDTIGMALFKDTLSKEALIRSFQEDNSLQNGENATILSQKAVTFSGISSNAVSMETSSGMAKSSLSASAVKIVSSETSNFVASSSLLDTPVQCVPLASNTKCYRCKEFGHSAQVCSKSPSLSKDVVRLTSSRCNIPATVIDNVNKCNAPETNQIFLGKFSEVQCLSNAVLGCSSASHDNVLSAGLKSTIEAFNNSSNGVAASQATAESLNCYADRVPSSAVGVFQTGVVAEIAHGSNSSSIQRKLISETMDRGTSDLTPCTLNETTVKSTDGYRSNETTPIAGAFCTEQSVMAQMGNQALDRWERSNLSGKLTSTTKITVGASQQCILPQKLPTLPESQFLWRGGFEIIDKVCCRHFYDGMQAYPSNRASPKVYEVSRKFPSQLHLEQVQRWDAWPKRFQESPPTDQDIALYIFPVEIERCQKPYMELLEDTIKHDLAMRVNLENAELLIFSSNQLPENYRRFNGRMYLWGVFRGVKKIPLVQNAKEALPFATDVGPNVLQDGPSAFSTRHIEDPLSRQLPCTDIGEANRGEEDMDIDMEGGREIEMSDRVAARTESEQVSVPASHAAEPSCPLDSKSILSRCESGKSGGPFEQVGPSLVASWTGHFRALDNADEHTRLCGSNKELDFPPGFAPPPGFCHPLAKSINNSGKSLALMPENASLVQFHTRPQERESVPAVVSLKTGREFTDKSLSPAFKSQGPNCSPGIGLEHPCSPSFEHEPAGKPPLLSSDHSLEHLTADCMVGKRDLEPAQNEMGPTSQLSVRLLSRNESSKSHTKTDHSCGSRGLSRSRSLTPIHKATDRTGSTAQMYKSRSFREQPSFTRINSRGMEEKREWGADSSREKEDKRERVRQSSEEKEDKGRGRNNSLEMEDNRGGPRNNSIERKDKRERARDSSRGNEEERERGRNCRESEDKRERGREYTEREKNEMGRDAGSLRHRSRYSGIQRHKDSGKHYHTSSDCHSHSQSPTWSYSSSRGKCRSQGAGNLMPRHQVNSSDTVSSDRHFMNKRPSLERDSECEEKFEITSFLQKGKAQMDNDYGGSCKQEKSSGKRMEPQLCSPEAKEQCKIIRSRETPEDQDENTKHQWSFTPFHDLNGDAVDLKVSEAFNATSLEQYPDQKYSSEIAPQEPLQQPIASDLMNLGSDLVSSSGIGEQSLMLEEDSWCAGSKLVGPKSVTCLQLFPVEERDCGEGEFIVNDCDFNLELQLGRQTSNKLQLSLPERHSAKMRSCNFMVKQGACPSRSRVICEDSKETDPSDLASILSLSMPQYRKEGNTWVEVAEDGEMMDEQDIDVKLTL